MLRLVWKLINKFCYTDKTKFTLITSETVAEPQKHKALFCVENLKEFGPIWMNISPTTYKKRQNVFVLFDGDLNQTQNSFAKSFEVIRQEFQKSNDFKREIFETKFKSQNPEVLFCTPSNFEHSKWLRMTRKPLINKINQKFCLCKG